MSSFKSSKSFHSSGQFSRRHKVSGLRLTIQASLVGGNVVQDQRRKRVWKACERCKIKKIKCDAGGPCKRCKEDAMICVTSSKRRSELESVPRAYAEVLENTNFALTATVEKLYVMLRNGDTWELDQPELNDHGIPIVHDVVRILGCMRGPQDDFWSYPGKLSDLHELEPKIYLPQPKSRQDKHIALSGVCRSSSECGRFRLPSQDLGTPFPPIKTATANPPIQQDDWQLSQGNSVPKHQQSEQKPNIVLPNVMMQETQDDASNLPFFPIGLLDNPLYHFSEPEIDVFGTRDVTNAFMSDIPLKDIDWALWSDLSPL